MVRRLFQVIYFVHVYLSVSTSKTKEESVSKGKEGQILRISQEKDRIDIDMNISL